MDAEGDAASLIQSVYSDFGSGVVAGRTGVVLQNRSAYFSLDPAHPNRLEPGKRPLHTLIASLAVRDGRLWQVLGCMGADGQPQVHLQAYTGLIDWSLDVQQAVQAPRWLSGRFALGDPRDLLNLEGRFPARTMEELERRGHIVNRWEDWNERAGHAHGITIDPATGDRIGGFDPRSDGAALGYDGSAPRPRLTAGRVIAAALAMGQDLRGVAGRGDRSAARTTPHPVRLDSVRGGLHPIARVPAARPVGAERRREATLAVPHARRRRSGRAVATAVRCCDRRRARVAIGRGAFQFVVSVSGTSAWPGAGGRRRGGGRGRTALPLHPSSDVDAPGWSPVPAGQRTRAAWSETPAPSPVPPRRPPEREEARTEGGKEASAARGGAGARTRSRRA